jgi:hypothetical protein
MGDYVLELNDGIPLGATFNRSPTAWLYPGSRYDQNVTMGQDTVELWKNENDGQPVIANGSLVYSITDPAVFVGTLGIGDGRIQTEASPTTFQSMLDILVNQSMIPSKSWGYTAGASYST